jgi:hypothetical protein
MGASNFLEPSGPVQACNGIALPLSLGIEGLYIILNFLGLYLETFRAINLLFPPLL